MTKFLKYLKPIDYIFLIISAGLIILQVYLELTIPDYTKELTQIVTTNANTEESIKTAWFNGGMMLLCAFSSMIAAIICSLIISTFSSKVSMRIRDDLYSHILSFSNKEIHQFHTASLITRTTNDVVQIQNFMSMGIQLLIKAPVMAIWGICKISSTTIEWTLATLIAVIIVVVSVGIIVLICLPKFKKIQKLTDDLNSQASENITGVRVIRAFNADKFQDDKYEKVNKNITDNNMVTSKTTSMIMPLITIVMNMLVLIIYWLGVYIINSTTGDSPIDVIVSRGQTLASMVAFSSYAMQIIMAFMMLIMVFIILPRSIVSAKRINEVLDTKSSIVDGKLNANDIIDSGTLSLENVTFSYSDDKGHPILENINLQINKGETVAIIGPTGCGKSTLVNLLLRFYDVTEGCIKVDGYDIRDYKLNDLRNRFSLATQKALLFKGTIKENVAFGVENVDEEKLKKSLDIANCEFVNKLDKKEDSLVSQGGSNFSGGQKQRISIARTLYKDSEIMIFDDTFSALDYKTDFNVRKQIKENLNDKTVIIVAQRIGTVKNADKIVVLNNGKIDAIGKHEDLLKTSEVYKEIALSQLSKEELENE